MPAALASFTGTPQMRCPPAADAAVTRVAQAPGGHAAVAVTTATPAVSHRSISSAPC
jgi:hypothetical protein